MKNKLKRIASFVKDSLMFLYFLAMLILQRSFKNNVKKKYRGTVAILANGPSLKDEIPKLTTNKEFKGVDFIVVNFFAFEEAFFNIKPKHYCLADPIFFQDSYRRENVKKVFEIFQNKIDWEINFYMPANKVKDFYRYSKISNKNIKIVRMNIGDYFGYENFRHFFYKKGLAMPRPQNVTNFAIYLAINSGYEELRLYGMDHTFFNSLYVNKKNQLCLREVHFYKNDENPPKPILKNNTGEVFTIGDYLNTISKMFISHEILEKYSKYMNVKIVNYAKDSMIDSYERKQ